MAKGCKITHRSILRFFFFFFFNILIFDWFSKIFLQKFLNFLQPVISKTIEIGNFKGPISQITLPEKPLMVLYTNGHISNSRMGMTSFWYQIKAESMYNGIKNSFYPVSSSLFCGSASPMIYIVLSWISTKATSWLNLLQQVFTLHRKFVVTTGPTFWFMPMALSPVV